MAAWSSMTRPPRRPGRRSITFYFPNGICVSHDGKSVLIASTSLCQVFRYWVEGPEEGRTGGSDREAAGQFATTSTAHPTAITGLRWSASARRSFDLAMRKPGFRLRMVKQVPTDEWLAPGLNHGCVLKFTESGRGAGILLGSDRHLAFHLDLDARAQGLSLSRRAREQPDRSHQARGRGSDMDRI